ncbi:PD-(D/E)XK nuclease family transposase [Rickettsia amblyommatis]|uniref:PD-(D/E)XK nuclease family transposase n=1 Tax=Rickettsia amblyommatis TaxID=33989 RepID=UPI0018E0702F
MVDVLCRDKYGTLLNIIVEIQVSKHPDFEKRAQLYAAKAYSRQTIKEDEDHKKNGSICKTSRSNILSYCRFYFIAR